MVLTSASTLDPTAIQLEPTSSSEFPLERLLEFDWRTAVGQFESAYARRLLHRHREHVAEAARAAGLAPRSLYKILHRLGLWPGPR
jgi:DNA-binding NtrC family response regulator